MSPTLSGLVELARFTLRAPRQGARAVINMQLPTGALWSALILVAVVSAVAIHLSFALQPIEVQSFFAGAMASPIGSAIVQAILLLLSVLVIHLVGRMAGGKGQFNEALAVVVWLQVILLAVQLAQLAFLLILPVLSDVIGIAGLILFLWLLTNFVAELHGFRSLGLVFLGIVGVFLAMVLVLAILLAPYVTITTTGM